MCSEPRAEEEGQAVALSPRFDEALVDARRRHAGQVRKGTANPDHAPQMAVAGKLREP